jgi:hypothetical protein
MSTGFCIPPATFSNSSMDSSDVCFSFFSLIVFLLLEISLFVNSGAALMVKQGKGHLQIDPYPLILNGSIEAALHRCTQD